MNKAIEKYKGKKVLILGLGLNRGGLGAAMFFASAGAEVRITDLRNKDELKPSLEKLGGFTSISYTLGEHLYSDIDWADLIIRNPAIKPENEYFRYALEKGKQVEMDMGILLEFAKPRQIIGITGTKGKSTTSTLIYNVLEKKFGDRVVFAGNIGMSVMDAIERIEEDSVVVLELSSFQLQAFEQHKTSPHIAVITNIYPDHLNYHKTFEEYIGYKKVIAKYQEKNDLIFIRKDDLVTDTIDFLEGLEGTVKRFSYTDLPKDYKPLLLGEHNLENIAAALTVVKEMGVDEQKALQIMAEFGGVKYRTELIKQWNGARIYNDTTATTPNAAIAALKAFPGCTFIAGGMNKKLDYRDFAENIDKYAGKVFLLEGDATEELKAQSAKCKAAKQYNDLEKLLEDVKHEVGSGDVVLFSPGATSFNLFKNEFDRGEKFNQAVEKVFG